MSYEGYSGKMAEVDLIGRTRLRRESKENFDIGILREYVPYEEALRIIEELQPGDPKNPRKPFPKALLGVMSNELDMSENETLEFFTAISPGAESEADYYHGVDFFINYTLDDGDVITVTFDVTTNPNKGGKADVIIEIPRDGIDPDFPEDKEIMDDIVDLVSRQAVRVIQQELEYEEQ